MSESKRKVCVIGAGPSGMSVLYNFANIDTENDTEIVCYEKQTTWGRMWNFTWRTGTDEYGEPCHAGMYKNLWSNGPKESLEYPDYTFEEHFKKAIPSFPPRAVLRDYLEDTSVTETFTHVVVAVGIFNIPNIPTFPGMETFKGRIIHSHNFRDAIEFKGTRLLLIGSAYSAEDIAMQCLKYGAKHVICTWRSKPMGFNWPEGIEERPLVQRFDARNAYFKDGTSAEIDAIIICTGYLYSFPFLEERLRLKSTKSFYPEGLYKGSLWLGGGNNKMFYVGVQDQYYSFTMFDVQALWICKYILGKLTNNTVASSQMKLEARKWAEKAKRLEVDIDMMDFQTDFVKDLCQDTGYTMKSTEAGKMIHKWKEYRDDDVITYRDHCFTSIYTGTLSPEMNKKWFEAFDDSIEAFTS